MKIFQINGGVFGSTGGIMFGIADVARQQGHETFCASPITVTNRKKSPKEDYYKIGSFYGRRMNVLLSKITGFNGCFSWVETVKLLRRIGTIQPDILHLHNLHNSYLNVPMLFKYIKDNRINVVWTLHDCWSFTGQCPYFTMVNCDKWKTGCYDCPQYREYPDAYVDQTKTMWKWKHKWFTGVQNMTIVTPSQWLADLVKQSYLQDYPIKVINNGIDLDVFKPIKSAFREKNGLVGKYLVLGVAFGWGKRKGLDVFIELQRRLDSKKYKIILVGTDDKIDKQLPDGILSIHRTENQNELAQIYSAVDLFANPTREENYPTVNMESIACGTPVLTFRTGGSSEMIDEKTGYVIECEDIDAMENEIIRISEKKPCMKMDCLMKAKDFDQSKKYLEYILLHNMMASVSYK